MAYDKKAANQKYYKGHQQECDERNNNYRKKNLKRVPFDVQNDWYNLLKECCETNGEKSINKFIKDACEERAKRVYGFTGFEEYHEMRKSDAVTKAEKAVTETETFTQYSPSIPEPAVLYNYLKQ